MAWYKSGSVNVTNGNATVYGNGSLWVDVSILFPGDIWVGPDGRLYEIQSFQSNTQLTLASVYLGATANTQSYAIMPIGLLPSALAQQVKTTLSTANTALSQAVRFDANQNLTSGQKATARSNIGATAASDVGLGLLSKSVAGSVDVTLSTDEAANLFYEFTGTLTANINVVVPSNVRQFFVRNNTTGAFTLTVKTVNGTGINVLQGARTHLECDGANVIQPTSEGAAIMVDGSGNVGIGEAAKGNCGGFNFLELGTASWMNQASTGNTYYGRNWYYNGAYKFKTANRALLYVQDDSGHSWLTAPVGAPDATVTFAQAMTLDNDGCLRVGATSRVGNERFNATTASSDWVSYFDNTHESAPYGLTIKYSGASPNGAINQFLYFLDSTTARFSVSSNGNVLNTNNSYGALSDLKLKENVIDATPKLENLMRVRVVSYNLKTDPDHKQLGVIAQEVEDVFPGIVEETPDYEAIVRTRVIDIPEVLDEGGRVIAGATVRTEQYVENVPTGATTKSVKYSVFVPMLIKAVQEQQEIIDDLRQRVAALETK